MMMTDRHALLLSSLILAVLIAAAAVFITLRQGSFSDRDLISVPVPEFARAEFSQNDLKGHISVVNFFASWCPPCEAEHAVLMKLKTDEGVMIYGVNYKDSDTGRQDFLQRLGNPYIAITSDRDGELGAVWNTTGTPETFIIDSTGTIRYHHLAPLTDDDLQNIIIPMIRKLQGST